MRVPFEQMKNKFYEILLRLSFSEEKAALCARIFAENSRDGVYSHGLNRFPVFVQAVKDGVVHATAEPVTNERNGMIEYWDGKLAPGMYTATLAMRRAIAMAKEGGIACVAVKNTNHWMRGGTYGWQAADAGCIGICATNAIGNMPPWGGTEPRLGNNPLVIAVPREKGHVVLDMAMSQFSYGKLQEYALSSRQLPVAGGYNRNGDLTRDPQEIMDSQRSLPVGFWKGSGLSLVIDVLVAALSGGRSVAQITADGKEFGLSQLFICIDAAHLHTAVIESILDYTRNTTPAEEGGRVLYPGEKTLATRMQNEREGVPVNEEIWEQVLKL